MRERDTGTGTGLSRRIAGVCQLASEVAGGRAAGTARSVRERLEEPLVSEVGEPRLPTSPLEHVLDASLDGLV